MLKVHLRQFKCHRDTEISLGPLTCLAGPNGTGKSSVFQALVIASQKNLSEVSEVENLRRKGSYVMFGRADPTIAVESDGSSRELFSRGEIRGDLSDLFSVAYFKFVASRLAKPSYLETTRPALAADGYGLASVVSNLITSEPHLFETFQTRLRRVLPWVRRVRTRPAKVSRLEERTIQLDGARKLGFEEPRDVIGQELLLDTTYAESLPSGNLSDGTLLVMGVLAAVADDGDGFFDLYIVLDDIEQGLHPAAQRELISVLRTCVETVPDLRIAVSTHSPYVVDEFKPEEVWVFNLDEEGATVVKRLSEHPDAARALEVLTTGEFLAAEGEEWVKK